MSFSPGKFAEKYLLARDAALAANLKGGTTGFELEWNMYDSDFKPVLTVGSLEPQRDLTDVRDTVRAYLAMMESAEPGLPYNVCSGRGLSIRALVETFAAHARRPIQIVQDPSRFRPNDPPLLVGDHSRLTSHTGWQPRIPFEQTIVDLLEYWRTQVARS